MTFESHSNDDFAEDPDSSFCNFVPLLYMTMLCHFHPLFIIFMNPMVQSGELYFPVSWPEVDKEMQQIESYSSFASEQRTSDRTVHDPPTDVLTLIPIKFALSCLTRKRFDRSCHLPE